MAGTGKEEKIVPDKKHDPSEKDLTEEDLGLQKNLEAALPELERVEKKTA